MNDEATKTLRKYIHDLANKIMLVEKAFGTLKKQVPPNRLTDIGARALEETKDTLRHMRRYLIELEATKPAPDPAKTYSLNQIRDGISFFRRRWESDFNLKILIPDHIKYGLFHTNIDPKSLIVVIEKALEINALAGASEVEITFNLTTEFTIEIHHNGKIDMPESLEGLEHFKDAMLPQTVKLEFNRDKSTSSKKLELTIPLAA